MSSRQAGRRWALVLVVAVWALTGSGCGGSSVAGLPNLLPFQSPAAGDPGYDVIRLQADYPGQYLVPVQVGNQVFRLLLDTGFLGVLVFDDLVAPGNRVVQRTDRQVVLRFGSGIRRGVLARAPVVLGNRVGTGVRIVLIQQPTSSQDVSLALRGADGILGLRFKPGATGLGGNEVDPILLAVQPQPRAMEFNLDPAAPTLTLGGTPVLNASRPERVFTTTTTTALGGDRVSESYADLEAPFRASSPAGQSAAPGLRVLLDTGAVDGLILDSLVASQLGWDQASRTWTLAEGQRVTLELLGRPAPLALGAGFPPSRILVAELSAAGFDAVLGAAPWQPYLVAFDFIDWTLGGPEGTFRFLARAEAGAAQHPGWSTAGYVPLPGLNTSAEDASPALNGDGSVLVFDSDRAGGVGLRDIYCFQVGQGLVALPGINSVANDEAPMVSADGNLIVFTSNRTGGEGSWDIYLYDRARGELVELPGLNSAGLERSPAISGDGRYISFRTEGPPGELAVSTIRVYDRETRMLLDLPGLNGPTDNFTSRLSHTGDLIAIDAEARPGGQGASDIWLYSIAERREVPLSAAVNSAAADLFPSLSGDGRLLAFQSDRSGGSGRAARDVMLFDLSQTGPDGGRGVPLPTRGINLAGYEDGGPALSGDGRWLAFASNRPRGLGGPDIYLVDLQARR